MNSLRDIWTKRFQHYMMEQQRYLKYVFTGHLAIVILFVIGAGGYSYSEWLKVVPDTFPAALLVSVVIGLLLTMGGPVTLLKEADIVYFLPLETKLMEYLQRSLSWTMSSQVFLSVIAGIVAVPLLNTVEGTRGISLFIFFVAIFVLKWWNVHTDFSFRWVNDGHGVWGDRVIRFLLSAAALYFLLIEAWLLLVMIALPIIFYAYVWMGRRGKNPFPFEHFIKVEQNRMLRFYRFANYFTDVPHLRGSIRRRGWLNFLYSFISYGQKNTQTYLVIRTFIRTDETFYLWVRLTFLSALGAVFIPIPIVAVIFSGALAFAATLQLKIALGAESTFRMDMLYPISESTRRKAVLKIVRGVQWLSAIILLIVSFAQPAYGNSVWLLPVIVIIISEATLRLSK
ncbi:ABC transporter permease [Chungangia koreensis]|uniref:ABC transporter permease n=1 Tax=Chungangia koreensis TaxID=752657 RepID=A0ABV8XA90_9LACT